MVPPALRLKALPKYLIRHHETTSESRRLLLIVAATVSNLYPCVAIAAAEIPEEANRYMQLAVKVLSLHASAVALHTIAIQHGYTVFRAITLSNVHSAAYYYSRRDAVLSGMGVLVAFFVLFCSEWLFPLC